MTPENHSQVAGFIWSIYNLLLSPEEDVYRSHVVKAINDLWDRRHARGSDGQQRRAG